MKVPASVARAISGETRDPHLAEVVVHFVTAAGGPQRVSLMMLEEWRAAKPGSIIRQRIMESILRWMKWSNERHGALSDLGNLSSEDLEREAKRLLGGFPSGQEEATADPGPGAAI